MTAPGNSPPSGNVHILPTPLAAAAAKLHPPPRIPGGDYDPATFMSKMDAYYFIAHWGNETQIIGILPGDRIEMIPLKTFQLELGHVIVLVPAVVAGGASTTKRVPGAKYWLANAGRKERDFVVFDPNAPTGFNHPRSYNLWRGFAVPPDPNTDKLGRILDHIKDVVCGGNVVHADYLLCWLAHMVQRPWEQCAIMVVLRSDREGAGKSTVSEIMLRIFGHGDPGHGLLIKSMDELIGRFTDHLETKIFIAAEEILWAGDPKTADALKSLITMSHIKIERKFHTPYYVKNRLPILLTTNHSWAVQAGHDARRLFIPDFDEARVRDKPYFDALYKDIENGGVGQFLHFLLNYDISAFSPNAAPVRTASLMNQQLKSAGSVEAWLYDVVVWGRVGRMQGAQDEPFNTIPGLISTETLMSAYTAHARRFQRRMLNSQTAAQTLKKVLGGRNVRLPPDQAGHRAWGYDVPDQDTLRELLNKHIGVDKDFQP